MMLTTSQQDTATVETNGGVLAGWFAAFVRQVTARFLRLACLTG
jgi:hypothetical protein